MNKLLVNVSGTMGRYLLVSISVVGSDAEFKEKMQAHDPQPRDMACGGALATKTLADLEKPGARNLIRSELISGFNNILSGALVQEIYLTEFAIQ
jgi:flagellar FliL protein